MNVNNDKKILYLKNTEFDSLIERIKESKYN